MLQPGPQRPPAARRGRSGVRWARSCATLGTLAMLAWQSLGGVLELAASMPSALPAVDRRALLASAVGMAAGCVASEAASAAKATDQDMAMEYIQRPHTNEKVPAKRRKRFPDFDLTSSGLQVKELDPGRPEAPSPGLGDVVVMDWEGYAMNYKGLPFETRKMQEAAKVEMQPLRFKVGDGTVIPAIDEVVRSMHEGSVKRLIVPVELGYDAEKKLLPRPCTFPGQRTLDFVLDGTGAMDKTLLFNVKLRRVYKGAADS
mmetsp:Transcript_10848/g.27994  ORF Transcript_10848/g.27994 Transcript_10848/m.27994 type:complete len:259 (-) Transcript_10848:490-1266(-)